MTTTAFQTCFDLATSIGVDKSAIVASTIARDQTTRAVSRGGAIWRFDVRLPDGMPWTTMRPLIEQMMKADRYTLGTVSLSDAGYTSWLSAYQGTATPTGMVATVTTGDTITLTSISGYGSGYAFRAGDLIQIGASGHVYVAAADTAYPSTTVTLNRPVLEAAGSYSLIVGPSVVWTVMCTDIPSYNIMARNQVAWSGSFKFVESLV